MDAAELVDALRGLFPKSHGWIVLPQVRDATGWQGNRTADAIALNAWPSRGLELHGFEVKTFRGDWQRELSQPAKAESVFRYCDRWWVVTPKPTDEKHAVARQHELPPDWGLLHVDVLGDGRVTTAKQAAKLSPAPLERVFLAAVLRALAKCEAPEALQTAAHERGRREGFKDGLEHAARRMRPAELEMVRWKRESLESLEKSAKRILDNIRRELADVKKLPELPEAADDEDDGEDARGRGSVPGRVAGGNEG